MKRLSPLSPITVGVSAGSGTNLCAAADLGNSHWVAVWLDAGGRIVHSTTPIGQHIWSEPSPMLNDQAAGAFSAVWLTGDARSGWRLVARESGESGRWHAWHRPSWRDSWAPAAASPPEQRAQSRLPAGTLASGAAGVTAVALRSGHRVVGVAPRFPSAGLVVSVTEGESWRDIAFADEVPDVDIETAALAVSGSRALACYVVPDVEGQSVCRVVQLSLRGADHALPGWRELPPYPQPPGMAGLMAGNHGEMLIAAGGANFPDAPPWEGGKKVTHADIHLFDTRTQTWRTVGSLPEPRAYAAAVATPHGLLVAGGENAEKIFDDCLVLRAGDRDVLTTPAPPLPAPVTHAVGALLHGSVYVAGGYKHGVPRVSGNNFWRLDLADPSGGWQQLPAWPGPARAQAVMAAVGGALYLMSGLELRSGADGKTQTTYLRDAYRYRPGRNWERLPDLPWSAVAAPSPAPVTSAPPRVFVLGGVDGRQAGKLPRDTPLPNDIIYFDVVHHHWRLWPEPWPVSVVTVPAIAFGDEWIIVSGEIMAGVRTTETWAWRISGR